MPRWTTREETVGLGGLSDEVFDAVLFDMDGTLIDSTPAVMRAWTTWRHEFGLSPEADGPATTACPSRPGRARAAAPRTEHVEAIRADQRARAGRRRTTSSCCPARPRPWRPCVGAPERDRHLLHGAAGPRADRGGRPGRRRRCWSPSTTSRHGKPAPDPFLEAARRLGVDPTRCLVVEDAPKGLEAAHAAGCATLAVVTTTAARGPARRRRGRGPLRGGVPARRGRDPGPAARRRGGLSSARCRARPAA